MGRKHPLHLGIIRVVKNLTILHSKRKTISIEIQAGGKIVVRAPYRTSQARIDALLVEKKAWIEEKLASALQLQDQVPVHAFKAGETFPYLGTWTPLRLVERAKPVLSLNGAFELAKSAQPRAREVFTAWYQTEAARLFSERLALWSAKTGLVPSGLGLSSARTRWGSCSPNGKINLTWRLVMAPLAVIDYVVVHELVHIKVKNHSNNFWNLVQLYLPDALARRKWLNENGLRLDL